MKNIIFYLIFVVFLFPSIHKEEIVFSSKNPFSFRDIIKKIDKQDSQEVYGILTLPDGIYNSDQKVPIVIGLAGSKDWGEHHLEYLEMYQSMGIATFELQSFKSRGISSTVGEQVQVTTAMMIYDSYMALDVLSNHPNIDPSKSAITGWSLGGGVTLYSAWEPLKEAINPKYNFSAHLAFYPPCFAVPKNLSFSDSPIHILIGELDNWVPAKACEELVDTLSKESVNINVTVYEDAHHSFDRDAKVVISEEAYNFTDCRFKIRNDGALVMNFIPIPMTTPLLQKIGLSCCAKRGPTYGGHPPSKEKSLKFSKDFMKKYLLSSID